MTTLDTTRRTVVGAFVSLRMNLLIAAQYRVNLVIWLFVSVLQAVVYLAVWQAVARRHGSTRKSTTWSSWRSVSRWKKTLSASGF